jgi:K(+)-stimulated pyrophosphate-energized sodium pump
VVGFLLGPEALGGFLAGATVSGVLMGMFQNNAGGAWDNAKKSFEKGVEINGEIFYKKSEPHKASVTGDTVGDPFKDTSGPSMNILIKLMSIVSLVIAPTLARVHNTGAQKTHITTKEVNVTVNKVSDNPADSGKVTIKVNGEDKMEGLVEALKADGLAKDGNLSIDFNKGELTVNGKKLPAEALKKYESFLEKNKDIKLSIKIDEK